MIGSVRGTVIEKDLESVLIEVGGIGYRVHIPIRILATIHTGQQNLMLHTSMQVREDSMNLYGFTSGSEKNLFEQLLTVSKVGPKVALAMLSVFTPDALAEAIYLSDITGIAKVPGIGKKTAERVVLELKEKIGVGAPGAVAVEPTSAASGGLTPMAEAREALAGLGYAALEIQDGLRGYQNEIGDTPSAEELVRFALARLSSTRPS